jgi:hypothetical protein
MTHEKVKHDLRSIVTESDICTLFKMYCKEVVLYMFNS